MKRNTLARYTVILENFNTKNVLFLIFPVYIDIYRNLKQKYFLKCCEYFLKYNLIYPLGKHLRPINQFKPDH